MSAQVAADLRAAAEVLRRDGWRQGDYVQFPNGACCATGAIRKAVYGDPWIAGYLSGRAERAVLSVVDPGGHSLPWWNDTPGRTADEVIAALEAAAERAEAEQ